MASFQHMEHEHMEHDSGETDSSSTDNASTNSTPTYEMAKKYSLPKNLGLPYTYNWDGYDGLPTINEPNSKTWANFPAGEATAFPITSVDAATLNNPAPLNGKEVPRPQDIEGNPVDLSTISTKNLRQPYTMAVSLVPHRTGPTPHVHWSDAEWFYVLSGSLDLWVGSNDYKVGEIPGQNRVPLESSYYYAHVKAGQMVQGHKGMLHSFTNTGTEPTVWLTFWRRDQSELKGGIEQFFTRGDISPFVKDYQASVDYTNGLTTEQSDARKQHWGETFPDYNVTISNKFGQYLTSQQTDPVYANAPGENNSSVKYDIPLKAIQDNGSKTLNKLLSSTPELRVSLNSKNGAVQIKNESNTQGVAIHILFKVNTLAPTFTEIGYYNVDDAKNRINGLLPSDPGYAEAALNNSKLLFYSLAEDKNEPVPVQSNFNLEVHTGQRIGFYEKSANNSIQLSTVQKLPFTESSANGFKFNFSNGIDMQGQLNGAIASLQDVIAGSHLSTSVPLLDTQTLSSKTLRIKSTISRESGFDSVAGFYKITDQSGGVKDPVSGEIIRPGNENYEKAALDSSNLLSSITFSVANGSSKTQTARIPGGFLYAPFIKVTDPVSKQDTVYFAFDSANPDKTQHIVSLGTNIFGFEDALNASYKDFNDLILQANFSIA